MEFWVHPFHATHVYHMLILENFWEVATTQTASMAESTKCRRCSTVLAGVDLHHTDLVWCVCMHIAQALPHFLHVLT